MLLQPRDLAPLLILVRVLIAALVLGTLAGCVAGGALMVHRLGSAPSDAVGN